MECSHSVASALVRLPSSSPQPNWGMLNVLIPLSWNIATNINRSAYIAEVRISMGCLSSHRLKTLNAIIPRSMGHCPRLAAA